VDEPRGGSQSALSFSSPKVDLKLSDVQVGGTLPATSMTPASGTGHWREDLIKYCR
jgi:hypothetical protein